jgi:hypothetical protein
MFSSKWPNNPTFFSPKTQKTMKQSKKNQNPEMTTTMEGQMTLGVTDNGLKILDFMCTEYVEMEPFAATCKVQGMRDGNVYITERPRRERNTPLFREDNSSLSKGADGNYYFYFMLPEEELRNLPKKLVNQAYAISQKVMKELITIE